MAGYKVSLYVSSDPQFTLSHDHKDALTIQGLTYASRSKVQRVFAGDFDHSVFSVPLAERRRRLLAIDWVEDASVSRVWPDRLVVRIRERKPVAFVSFRSGVAADRCARRAARAARPGAVRLPGADRRARRSDRSRSAATHVRAFLQVQEDMGYLAKDVSEVDATDPENIRIVCAGGASRGDSAPGRRQLRARFQNFLNHYPEIRKGSPEAKVFDLRLDDRITVKE